MSPDTPIILFHYPHSPFSARVLYYLALRGIPYDQCIQPQILPRPDLAALGIRYRRIPLLSIGRDVYLDSKLILSRLERLTTKETKPPFSASATNTQQALQTLLSSYTQNTALFSNIAKLVVQATPLLKNDAFMKDRTDMISAPPGYRFEDFVLNGKADAVLDVKRAVEFLEYTLLKDGRLWLAGKEEEGPGLEDIEMVWPLAWLFAVPGAVPGEVVGREKFPRVWDWVERFSQRVEREAGRLRKPETLSGGKVKEVLAAAAADETGDVVDEEDLLVKSAGLKRGDVVQVWPTDSGARHKTVGRLVGLTDKEITVETIEGDVSVRVHAPRQGFAVAAVKEKANLS
ncbi:hypothetical protein BJY04DRAFT_220310 [Aspergillus karnatakaensis]|uniref:uncharacterized protein n=1 Tax=Aspergillus karnatakaensis TaxID=1810916 RepID=UPI003CCCC8F2